MEDENKIYTTKELKEIFTNICKNIEEIDKVILFGSYAKNKANENSDINIYVLCNDTVDINNNKTTFKIKSKIKLAFDSFKSIDIIISNKEVFNKMKEFSFNIDYYVLKEGTTIFER